MIKTLSAMQQTSYYHGKGGVSMTIQPKSNDLIVKYKDYNEYVRIGRAPNAKWDAQNKVWIIKDYKAYIDDVKDFIEQHKSDIKNSVDFILNNNQNILTNKIMISGKTIYVHSSVADTLEDEFLLEDLSYKREKNKTGYYPIPNSISTRRILNVKFNLGLDDSFSQRDIEIDSEWFPKFLFPHQVEGVSWLLSQYKHGYVGSLLADDMGLGKTVQSLALYHVLKQVKPDLKLFVVATKSTLKNSWASDLKKFFNQESYVITTDDLRNGIQFDKPVIVNYEALSYIFDEDKKKLPTLGDDFILILDEATKIKNSNTRIFKAINHIRGDAFTIALTGTPVENNLDEYYTILRTIQPDFMPRFIFNRLFVEYETIRFGPKVVNKIAGHKNLDLFHRISNDFVLRRTKSILDIPSKKIKTIVVPLTYEQQRLIELITERAKERLDASVAKYATLTIIKRISDHPKLLELGDTTLGEDIKVYDYKAPKLETLKEIISSSNKPVVVFTEYENMAELIKEEVSKNYSVAMISGANTSRQRNKIIKDFKDGKYEVLVATDALAYGVNLQFANTLINYDIPWNPAKRAQRMDRIHRIGIKEEKIIYDIVSEGLEFHAYKMITNKLEIFAKAVEGKENLMTSSVLKQLSEDYFDNILSE